MKLRRRLYDEEDDNRRKRPLVVNDVTYWEDTKLGKYIINDLRDHFTAGNSVPRNGTRFTAVTKDGRLYFNDNAEELKDIIYIIDRWIDQETLNFLIDQPDNQ